MMQEVKAIYSYNTDWYQWGLNAQILEYDKKSTEEVLEMGLKYYKGTTEDADLYWQGYYSKK